MNAWTSTPCAWIGAAVCAAATSMLIVAVADGAEPPKQLTADAVLERVRSDLAVRRGVASSEIRTITVKEVVWRDMSLGCGKPTESYAQIDVEGWQIALEYKAERFDYRARKDGGFILCKPSLMTPR
jgi:hypothetical protein